MRMLLALALIGACPLAVAQPPASPPPRPSTIQVTGQANVSQPPDRAYIDIGVTTQARNADTAASQNARRLSGVIAAVKRAAGAGAQLSTTQYSLAPSYRYPREGGSPTIVGYSASNVVQVRLDDLRRIGPVIDAAAGAGSNNVQNIRFALRDEAAARSEALRQAASSARHDAETLAGALGLRVTRVLAVTEQGPEARPIPLYARTVTLTAAKAAPTPVEAGTIDVNATITLTVEVVPAKR